MEDDVINELAGKSADDSEKNKSKQTDDSAKEKNPDDIIQEKVKEKQAEKDKQNAKEKEVEELAEAKNIIKSLSIESFENDDVQIEAQSVLDLRKELGDVKVAEKLQRLSVFDKALKMLESAEKANLDSDIIEMLKDITDNKRGFDVKNGENTLKVVGKVIEKTAVKNIGENIEVDLSLKGKNMKNSVYFVEEAKQRQLKKEREALAFFRGEK